MWNIGGLGCRLGQMDGTIKVSCGAVGAGRRGPAGRWGGRQAGRRAPGSRKTWPLSLPRPRFARSAPLFGWPVPLSGRPARLPTEGDLPHIPSAKGSPAPSCHSASGSAGAGGLKAGDPGRGSESGTGDLRVYRFHPATRAPWLPRRALAASFLSPEAESGGGRGSGNSRLCLGSLPDGPGSD